MNVSESVEMERNVTSLKFGIESSVLSATHAGSICGACGEDFETPLFAMVLPCKSNL